MNQTLTGVAIYPPEEARARDLVAGQRRRPAGAAEREAPEDHRGADAPGRAGDRRQRRGLRPLPARPRARGAGAQPHPRPRADARAAQPLERPPEPGDAGGRARRAPTSSTRSRRCARASRSSTPTTCWSCATAASAWRCPTSPSACSPGLRFVDYVKLRRAQPPPRAARGPEPAGAGCASGSSNHRKPSVNFNVQHPRRPLDPGERAAHPRRRHRDPADRHHRADPDGAAGARQAARRAGAADPRHARPHQPGHLHLRRRASGWSAGTRGCARCCRRRSSSCASAPASPRSPSTSAGRWSSTTPPARSGSSLGGATRDSRPPLTLDLADPRRRPSRHLRPGDARPRLRDQLHRRHRRARGGRGAAGGRTRAWSSAWHERTLALEDALAEAERANASKSRFVAAASHDLLQPLSAAKLFLASLENADGDADQAATIRRVRSAFDSVESILGALLDISRLDSGNVTVTLSTFPLGTAARAARRRVPRDRPAEGRSTCGWCRLERRGAQRRLLPAADRAEPARQRRALHPHAARCCSARGGSAGAVRIEVWDTGPGIPEGEREIDLPRVPAARRRRSDPTAAWGSGSPSSSAPARCSGTGWSSSPSSGAAPASA